MPSSHPVIVWFRRDLRIADNPALTEATQGGRQILPVYILEEDNPRPMGAASRWWLHHSLKALGRSLTGLGAPLLLLRGKALEELPKLAAASGARSIMWNRRTDPAETAIDHAVTARLVRDGLQVETFVGDILFEPGQVTTRTGQPFQVFTPFWRACLALPEPYRPLPAPKALNGRSGVKGDGLEDWKDLPARRHWSDGLACAWTPGEDAALARLHDFLAEGLTAYCRDRNMPDLDGTSRLSPHLAFGEVGPRQIWHAARAAGAHPEEGFLRELGWREFCRSVLHNSPDLPEQPQRSEFAAFPWSDDQALWQAFISGRTGYPIVDAGMRALWETGWMHNRVRMVVASFLVKDLMIPWQKGRAWFDDTLVDADTASNAAGWQWVAGCGIDSAPYFRIFNPVLQGEKYDRLGHYVRRWVPEIAGLPDRFVHRPWTAPPAVLAQSGLTLGRDYPPPIVDHDGARRRALLAFKQMRNGGEADLFSPPAYDACERNETPGQ